MIDLLLVARDALLEHESSPGQIVLCSLELLRRSYRLYGHGDGGTGGDGRGFGNGGGYSFGGSGTGNEVGDSKRGFGSGKADGGPNGFGDGGLSQGWWPYSFEAKVVWGERD
jgi:hypothetical protein